MTNQKEEKKKSHPENHILPRGSEPIKRKECNNLCNRRITKGKNELKVF